MEKASLAEGAMVACGKLPPLPKGGGPPTDYYFNIKIIISEKGGGGIHEVEKIKLFMLLRCAYNAHFSNFTNG